MVVLITYKAFQVEIIKITADFLFWKYNFRTKNVKKINITLQTFLCPGATILF